MLNPFLYSVGKFNSCRWWLHLFYKVGFLNYYNPTVELLWVTPPVVAETFYGGIRFGAMIAVVIA